MSVLVDTSAWVDYLNGFPSPAADALTDLLQGEEDIYTCGIVAAEVFQGLRRDRERGAIQRSFQDLLFLEPSGIELYLRAAELCRSLRKQGVAVRSTVDCTIAALAEVNALLSHMDDSDVGDFIEWGWLTGMRRGEISQLTWDMLDRSEGTWVLRVPSRIVKNKDGRAFGFAGRTRTIIERRLQSRRFDCPLIFHRSGRKMGPFRDRWRSALNAAGLPPSRLFHDLRRSAVRTLIRSGVDPTIAMKVSGHKTRSMLDRYNIIEETETAAALQTAEAWLEAQPKERNVVNMGRMRTGTIPAQPPSAGAEGVEAQARDWCRRWDLNPH